MLSSHTAESLLRRSVSGALGPKAPDRSSANVKLGRLLLYTFASPGVEVHTFIDGDAIREGSDKHVEYNVSTNIQVNCPRRYSQFKELHNILRSRFPNLELPQLPDVSWKIGLFRRSFNPEHILQKKMQLELYLQQLVLLPQVRSCPEFLHFLLYSKDFQSRNVKAVPGAPSRGSQLLVSTPDLGSMGSINTMSPHVKESKIDFQSELSQDDTEESWNQPLFSLQCHPVASRLVSTVLKVAFLDCDSFEQLRKTDVMFVFFEELKLLLEFKQFQYDGADLVTANTNFDGIDLTIKVRVLGKSPLSGITIIS